MVSLLQIVVLDGYTLNHGDLDWNGIGQYGPLTVHERIPHAHTDILAAIGGAVAVFTNKTPLPAEVLAQLPALKYIGVLATGYNVVDVAAAKAQGIVVTNVPAYGTEAVAQYTMGLLLELCGHMGTHGQAVREGAWAACPDFCFWRHPLVELHGKTLGLVGYGRIGRAVARMAQAFGMAVVVYSRSAEPGTTDGQARFVPLASLWGQADVVSLHCPLTPETEGMVNRQTLSMMKPDAFLLNTARGQLVVEEDLAAALNQGRVAAAALDVVATEPMRHDNPLLKAKNCLITPHVAWAAKAARQRLMDTAAENLAAFLRGQPVNVVS